MTVTHEAVLADETYVAYSQYARQLAPWQAAFGAENILVMAFEDYVQDRRACLSEICRFLGVDPPDAVADTHRNKSEGKHVVREGSPWARIAQSEFYLYRIKPLLPTGARDRIKALLLPKTRKLDETLTEETLETLRARLGIR